MISRMPGLSSFTAVSVVLTGSSASMPVSSATRRSSSTCSRSSCFFFLLSSDWVRVFQNCCVLHRSNATHLFQVEERNDPSNKSNAIRLNVRRVIGGNENHKLTWPPPNTARDTGTRERGRCCQIGGESVQLGVEGILRWQGQSSRKDPGQQRR